MLHSMPDFFDSHKLDSNKLTIFIKINIDKIRVFHSFCDFFTAKLKIKAVVLRIDADLLKHMAFNLDNSFS